MFKFNWRIENFSLLLVNTGEFIESPSFEAKLINDVKFSVRLYPEGKKDSSYIGYHLCADKPQAFELGTKVTISFTNKSKSESMDVAVNSDNEWLTYRSFYRKNIEKEDDKFHDLFLSADNLDVECLIQKPNCDALSTPIACYKKTVVQTVTHIYDLPLTENIFTSAASWDQVNEYSKNFFDYFTLRLKIRKLFENSLVEISKVSVISMPVYVCRKISLIDATNLKTVLVCDGHLFKAGSQKEIWQKSFNKILSITDGFTNLRCEIIVSRGNITTIDPTEEKVSPTKILGIVSNKNGYILLNNMYETKTFSDLILQVGSDQFPAHKCVLGSVSDVFAAMFTNKMKEEETNVVEITDIDKDIISKMLQFVYAGKIENLDQESLEKLYSTADKYQILELKKLCSFYLAETVAVDNCLEVLDLADMHQDSALVEATRDFIYTNRKEILDSDNWECFMEKRLKLAADIMFCICQRS